MFGYNPIGKTLLEVARDCSLHYNGYSVFVLQDENDTTGKHLDEDFSVRLILKKHPEYADYKVKFENDFFGTTVLRVIRKSPPVDSEWAERIQNECHSEDEEGNHRTADALLCQLLEELGLVKP